MSYIPRPLRNAILKSTQKVVIVEGARAVGKTSMAHHELEPLGYAYYTLADNTTYEIAKIDPDFWVRSINLPAIIDEAQRISALTLAIKEYVDSQEDTGTLFILTGSASIGKAGLDGQDPLTRRSQRFSLNPLTQREIIANSSNLVDDLWSGKVNPRFESDLSEKQLETQMSIGGFPYYVKTSAAGHFNDLGEQIRSDLINVIGDTVLPKEHLDQAIARAILNRLLSLPGDILNVSSMGKALNCNNRTIERYVSIFASRFLIRYLPNLKQLPQKQSFTRAKIHPVDVSFSVETLKVGGREPFADRALFGKLLESYIIAQIIPNAQWSSHKADCYYWREAGRNPKEVDLVLLRNNEIIGIEVKASTRVSQEDLKGLRALASDQRFRYGYVVYLGKQVIRFSEKICAIPVSALWEPSAFSQNERMEEFLSTTDEDATDRISPQTKTLALADANLFLSYSHADNDHLDNAMVTFAKEIASEYEFQFGNTLQTFIDDDSLRWGDDWQAEIDRNIEETHFLVPCVTPRYMRSPACRQEFLQFLAHAKQTSGCRILSLIWQKAEANENDQIGAAIHKHQYRDISSLRDLSPKDVEYKKVVRSLVEEIHAAIVENATRFEANTNTAKENSETPHGNLESESGLDEKLDIIAEKMPAFNRATDDLKDSFKDLTVAFNELPFPNTGTGGYTKWAISLAKRTESSLDRMNDSVDQINEVWIDCYALMSDLINLGRETGQDVSSLLPTLYTFRNSITGSFNIEEAESLTKMLPALSSRLKPLAKGLKRFIDTLRDIDEMSNNLITDAESLYLG